MTRLSRVVRPAWLPLTPRRGGARHSLAAPYVLNAVGPAERRSFERHLTRCPRCRDDVRTLAQDAVRLACPTATAAPPSLRDGVLAAVRTIAQDGEAQEPRTGPPPSIPSPRPRPWPALAATAVVAVLALLAAGALAVQAAHNRDALDAERDRTRAVAGVLAAPDARTEWAGRLGVVASAGQGRAVVFPRGLGDPPGDRVHQLWLMCPGAPPRSLGLLHGDEPLVAGDLPRPSAGLAVTVEPDGGSARPTNPPIVQVALKSVGFGEEASTGLWER